MNAKNVLAYGRTLDEIAVKWRQIDIQKVLVEKLTRQSGGCSDQRLAALARKMGYVLIVEF